MSDDLLRRLDEWGAAKRLEYLPSLGREAAARIRELEADDAYVALKRNNDDLRERAERAEAERDEQLAELSKRMRERAKLMNDNDTLRALLREAQSRSVYIAAPASDDHRVSLRERIDAFLGAKP